MRSTLPTLLGLVALTACTSEPAVQPDAQTGPVAIELLVQAANECDQLEQEIKSAWYSAPAVDGAVLAQRILAANPGRGVRITILEQEAERRVAELKSRKDVMAEVVADLYAATRQHCATIAYPGIRDSNAYNRETRYAGDARFRAQNAAVKIAPPRDPKGDEEVRIITERIQVAQAGLRPTVTVSSPEPSTRSSRGGVSSDSAPSSTGDRGVAFSAGGGALLLHSWSCRRSGETLRIEGEVQNTASTSLAEGIAVVKIVDYSGNEKASLDIPLQTRNLAPADRSRFSTTFNDKQRNAYRATISFTDGTGNRIDATSAGARMELYIN